MTAPAYIEHEAVAYNAGAGHGDALWRRIQRTVGTTVDGDPGPLTARAVRDWQQANGLAADGKVGPATLGKLRDAWRAAQADPEWRPLTPEEVDRIVAFTVAFEGGGSNPYSAMNRDGEWRGLFDRPKRDESGRRLSPAERARRSDHKPHWASRYGDTPTHIGASVGAWQFTQDGGALGRVLARAYDLDPEAFAEVFGPDHLELLEVTGRRGGSRVGGRSPRVQPVGGADLWDEPWVSRFRRAGEQEFFRQAQRQIAAERYLTPMLETAAAYGFDTQASLAVLFDIAIQFGVTGARTRVARALGSPQPVDDQDAALEAVIDELPEARRPRRRHIAAAAELGVRYRLGGGACV